MIPTGHACWQRRGTCMNEPASVPIAIAGVSHHTADVNAIELFRFPDEPEFLKKAVERFKGVSYSRPVTGLS